MKLLIDSSVWIEYFSGGPKSKKLEKYFKPPNEIVLSTIVSYEVYKKIKAAKGEGMAILILAQMEGISNSVISMEQGLAVRAADISLQFKIPMADAMIYSTACFSGATVITMDIHFKSLPHVLFVG